MKNLFHVGIAFNELTGEYFSIVDSLTDQKHAVFKGKSLRVLLAKMNKRIREKTQVVKKFPIVEPSRIITLGGRDDPKLVVPARN